MNDLKLAVSWMWKQRKIIKKENLQLWNSDGFIVTHNCNNFSSYFVLIVLNLYSSVN